MGEIIKTVKRASHARVKPHPAEGETGLILHTSIGVISASAILYQNRIIWLTLSHRLLKPNGSLRMVDKITVIKNSLSGMEPPPARRWTLGAKEITTLEYWFSSNDTFEGIYDSQLFIRELRLLVDTLEQGAPIGALDQ